MRFGQHDQLDQPVAQTKTLRSDSDHYCGKSAATRTHDSNQTTRPPRAARFALVCVDSNLTSMAEARVEGAQSAICTLLID